MQILVNPAQFELIIRGSRFLAEAVIVNNQEEARETLRLKKQEFADATHVVHGFVIGPQANVLGCSDDGEPAGTAGRPALEVLKNSGITNIMVTITRWFGGTKLGTGGLVRAYTQAVQEVLKICQTRELVEMQDLAFSIPYGVNEAIRRRLPDFNFQILSEEFGQKVTICGKLPAECLTQLQNALVDMTKNLVEFH